MSTPGPPPGISYNDGNIKRKTTGSSASVDNPRFNGSSESSSSDRRHTPIGEIFPAKKSVFSPKPPSKREPEIKRRLSRPPSEDFGIGEDDYKKKFERNKQREKEIQKNKPLFSLGIVDREHDPKFKADDIEDINYDSLFEKIDKLPFYEKIVAKKGVGRAMVAFVAVGILWLTSLAFLLFLMNDLMFPRPSLTEMVDGMVSLMEFVENERADYSGCNERQFVTCQNAYDEANGAELSRATANLETNEANLDIYTTARVDALTALNDSLLLLIDLSTTQDIGLLSFTVDDYDPDLCPNVDQYINDQLSSSAAASTFAEFNLSTEAGLDSLFQLFEERDEFSTAFFGNVSVDMDAFLADLAEFQANKTAEIMQGVEDAFIELESCITGSVCGGTTTTVASLVNDTVDNAEAYAALLEEEFEDVYDQVEDFIDSANNLYDAIDGIAGSLGAVGISIPTPSPSTSPTVSFEGQFEGNEEAGEALTNTQGFLDDAFSGISETIGNSEAASELFGETASETSSDDGFTYNAPTLDPTARDEYNTNQEQNAGDFEDSISAVEDSQTLEDTFIAPIESTTNKTEEFVDVVSNLTDEGIEFFSYDTSLFNEIQIGFDSAFTAAIWFDVLYRMAKTVMVINKYWNLSKIGKPPADVRIEEQLGLKFGTKPTKLQKNLEKLTHPAVLNLVAVIMVTTLSTLFWLMYSPFFYEFEDGCVIHDEIDFVNNETDGTMIFRNLFTFVFNYAVQDGDAIATTSVDTLNVQRESDCENNFFDTAETFDNQVNLFNSVTESYDEIVEFRSELLSCIDPEKVDSTEYDTLIADESFEVEMEEMLDGVYNCSLIPSCDVICSDPNEAEIRALSFNQACGMELFIHGTLLSVICLALAFATLVVFRKLFMSALVRLFWRDLNPFDFNVYATTTRAGTHIDPGIVKHDGYHLEDAIAEALQKALLAWENQSRLYMLYAVMLNIPWITLMFFFSSGIDYDYE